MFNARARPIPLVTVVLHNISSRYVTVTIYSEELRGDSGRDNGNSWRSCQNSAVMFSVRHCSRPCPARRFQSR
eukprot:3895076-Amphidinium_carterae.1